MKKPIDILQQYWNHDDFRPLQLDIIESVLNGNDTMALLPTGGGKSICFQVPAMIKDGICLVISPLIALIKDQVTNLENRGIKAMGIYGNVGFNDLLVLLDNCQFGNYKFLYISPERLQNEIVLERIKNMPIKLIAIDEAHCVSQWGHDFRPAYLKINILKDIFENVPFLALTATATKRVQDDMILQLQMKNPIVFQQSYARPNIGYMVIQTEDKLHKIAQIIEKNPQSSIVYVRNRKACLSISQYLNNAGFESTYFHGGLSMVQKMQNMNLWMNNKAQVIVATNAFGMGIDKPDVKTVIHYQMPDNLENYYQEAGRVGRNGQKSFAILMQNTADVNLARAQFLSNLPDKIFLKLVYNKLNNYFQIPFGEGIGIVFSFNLNQFCLKYNLPILKTYNALQFLDQQNILSLTQLFSQKISIQFLITSRELIRFSSLNPKLEPTVNTILRNYTGLHENSVPINTNFIAKQMQSTEAEVLEVLNVLKSKKIVDFVAKENDSQIIFNEVRDDDHAVNRILKYLLSQNNLKTAQLDAMIDYAENKESCKSKLILQYFGEKSTKNCGICSYCISIKNKSKPNLVAKSKIVLDILTKQTLDSRSIQSHSKLSSEDLVEILQALLENKIIVLQSDNKYGLK